MRPFSRSLKKNVNNQSPLPIGLLASLTVIAIALVVLYISSEQTFYWWDYTTYQRLLDETESAFRASPLRALISTWRSAGSDYGKYPTLLLLPLRFAFGDSRLVYILSVALVYFVPFALALGAIATQLIPTAQPNHVRWTAGLVTLATPIAWAPTLRGYVDIGAALLMALAVYVYLQDVKLKSRRQSVAIGVLLGCAPLFRRHYAYAVIAFLAALGLQALIDAGSQWRQSPRQARQALIDRGLHIGLVVVVILTTIVLLGRHFILRILHNDFSSLYTSYDVSLSQGWQYFGISFGWVACLIAALGYAIGLKTRILSSSAVRFIVSFYGMLFLLWVVKVKIIGVHYTTHFTPLIILGLVSFGWTIWLTLKKNRRLALGIFVTYLAINLVIGLAPVSGLDRTFLRPTRFGMSVLPDNAGTPLSELFAANNAPLRRTDYNEVVRLNRYLVSLTPNQEPIYIGGSSALFNGSIITSTDQTLHHKQVLNLLPVEDVDSRDRYPIDQLLQAEYVVVAEPFQYNLRPAEQDVVKVINEIFATHWQIAQDFKRLPEVFRLTNGITVNIYKRQRSTSLSTAINTFEAMRNFVGSSRPGGQFDWVATTRTSGYSLWEQADVLNLATNSDTSQSTSFLYINPLHKTRAKLTAKIQPNDRPCRHLVTRLDAIDRQAHILNTVQQDHDLTQPIELALPIRTEGADYLLLTIAEDLQSRDRCKLMLNSLNIAAD